MTPRRAIGERLKRASSLAARRETAMNWATRWRDDHLLTMHNLEMAIATGDMEMAGRYCGQLKVLHGKAMRALPRVIDALSDEDIA